MAGWYILYTVCLVCMCNPRLLVWFGLVWMREGSILINNTCTGGEPYIKLVCRLTRATCCGFMCVCGLAAQASMIQAVQIRTHWAQSISHLISLVHPLSRSCWVRELVSATQNIYYQVKPRINLFPILETSFRNKIIIQFCFQIISCVI